MKGEFNSIIGVMGCAVGFIGIGYAIGIRKKMNNICGRLDKSIDELSNNMDVDISEEIVRQAMNKTIEKEVKIIVRKAANDAVSTVTSDIRKEVDAEVRASYSDIKQSVSDEIKKQVSRINIGDLKNEVVEKAKQDMSIKFNNNLDDILDKFNGDLNNISKIYKSIASSITNDNNKNITLSI